MNAENKSKISSEIGASEAEKTGTEQAEKRLVFFHGDLAQRSDLAGTESSGKDNGQTKRGGENSKLLRISDIAKNYEYSKTYLSLSARRGNLRAKKIGGEWYTTKEWVDEFTSEAEARKKEIRHELSEKLGGDVLKKEKIQLSETLPKFNLAKEWKTAAALAAIAFFIAAANLTKADLATLRDEALKNILASYNFSLSKIAGTAEQNKITGWVGNWKIGTDKIAQIGRDILDRKKVHKFERESRITLSGREEDEAAVADAETGSAGKGLVAGDETSQSSAFPSASSEDSSKPNLFAPQILTLLDHNLTHLNIAEHSVRRWNLNTDSVNSKKIKNYSVEARDLSSNSVKSRTIEDHSIQSRDLQRNIRIRGSLVVGENTYLEGDVQITGSLSMASGGTLTTPDISAATATIGTLDGTNLTYATANLETIDLGTNTITDQNFTGNWSFNNGSLSGINDLDATSGTIITLDGTTATFTTGNLTTLNATTVDFGTNTITDQNFTGNWSFNNGSLSGLNDLDATSGTITTLDGTTLAYTTGNLTTLDLGTNTISDQNMTGDWSFNEGNLTDLGSLTISENDADLTFTGTGNHDITASSGTLRLGANVVIGNIEALDDSIDIGTPGTRFDKIYANEVNATTLVGTIVAGNVAAETLTINSDYLGPDAEDSYLAFERGSETPNALLHWVSASDLFDMNTQLRLTGTILADPTLLLNSATAGDTDFWLGVQEDGAGDDNDTFQIGDGTSPGTNPFLTITTTGNVGVGTTTPGSALHLSSATSPVLTINTKGDIAVDAGIDLTGDAGIATEGLKMWYDNNTGESYFGNVYQFAISSFHFQQGTTDIMTLQNNGNVGIGTTSPSSILNAISTDSATNAVTNILTLGHNSSGTPAASFGTGLLFQGMSDMTANRNMVQVSSLWTTAADATRTSALTFSTVNSAAALAEAMRINGDGNVNIGYAGNYYETKLYVKRTETRTSGVGYVNGIMGEVELTPSSNSDTQGRGVLGVVYVRPNGTSTVTTDGNPGVLGLSSTYLSNGTGLVAGLNGGDFTATGNSANPVTSVRGVKSSVALGSSQTANISNGYIFYGSASDSGAGNFNNLYGLYLEDISGITVGTNKWAIYSAGGNNYFAGNVGIGTTTPGSLLNIKQAADGDVTKSFLITSSDGYSGGIFRYGGLTGQLVIRNNSIDTIALQGGNVGIGTTNPDSKLSVQGASASATLSALSLINTGIDANWTNGTQIKMGYGVGIENASARITEFHNAASFGSRLQIQTHSTTSGVFNTGLFMDETGNVGIGTTTPGDVLSIYKQASSTTQVKVTNDSSADGAYAQVGSSNGTYVANVGLGGAGVLATGAYAANQAYLNTSALGLNIVSANASGVTRFYTGGSAVANERMRIDAGGNVGIGTTTPGQTLDVVGGVKATTRFQFGTDLLIWSQNRLGLGAGVPGIESQNALGLEIVAQSGGPIAFGTSSGEKVRILASGNVGIGTTAPTSKMHITETSVDAVRGLIVQQNAAGAYAAQLQLLHTRPTTLTALDNDYIGTLFFNFYNDAAIPEWVNGAYIYGRVIDASDGTEDADLVFNQMVAGTNTETMRLSGGNVGIGTTTPAQHLDVYGSGSQLVNITSTNNQAGYSIWNAAASNNNWSVYMPSGSSDLRFYNSSGADRVTFLAGGNVGIGTTTPDAPFDVEHATNPEIRTTNTGASYSIISQTDSGGAIDLRDSAGNEDAVIRSYGISYFNGGNVGIGTTTPGSYRLDVQGGNIRLGNSGENTYLGGTTYYVSGSSSGSNLYALTLNRSGAALANPDIWKADGSGLVLGGASGENTVIIKSGNVGIGTTNPGAKLQINTADNTNGLRIGNASGSPRFDMSLNATGDGSVAVYEGSSGLTKVFLNSNGLSWFSGGAVGGAVGIGQASASYTLDVGAGNSGYNIRGYDVYTHDGGVHSFSDVRLKTIEGSFDRGLDEILALSPQYYHYKSSNPLNLASQETVVGLIAQDVQRLIPEAVQVGQSGYLTLTQGPIFYAMLNAVKEQQLLITQNTQRVTQNDEAIDGLNLKTTQNVETVQQLQTSVDQNLVVISSSLADLDSRIASNASEIQILNTKLTAAEQNLIEQELNLATFQASTTDTISTMLETENMLTERVVSHEDWIAAIEAKMSAMTVAAGGEIPANVITTDESGNAKLAGIFEAEGIVAGSVDTKNLTLGKDISGSETLDAGETSVTIPTPEVSKDSKIYVTPLGKLSGRSLFVDMSKVKEGESFVVELDGEILDDDLDFNWLVVK